jgi:hypothetical protein
MVNELINLFVTNQGFGAQDMTASGC